MKLVFLVSVGLIFYTYFGYPLLIDFLALFAKKPKFRASDLPSVSLIIAAFNEEAEITAKINNSLALNYPSEKMEILVAADGSTDKTKSIVETYKDFGVKLSYQTQRMGKMAAISRAVNQADGDVLVFSDANNLYEEITFKYLLLPFADEKVGGTTGSKRICDDNDPLSMSEGLYWRYESWIKENESRLNSCTAAAGETFAMRKALYNTPPAGVINDDFYFLLTILKKGYKVLYMPEAKSWEHVSASEEDEIQRRKRINAGRYQALFNGLAWLPWNNPLAIFQIASHKFLRLFVPIMMISAFVSNGFLLFEYQKNGFMLLSAVNRIYFLLFLGQVGFYLMAALNPLLSKKGVLKFLYLPAFLVNSNWASLQGLLTFIGGGQTASWARVNRRKND